MTRLRAQLRAQRRRKQLRAALIGLLGMAAGIATTACITRPSDFARVCSDIEKCDDGSLCVEGQCVPPREAGAPGESCAAPLPMTQTSNAGLAIAQLTTTLGAARDDVDVGVTSAAASCEDSGPDIVVTFDLEKESGVRVRAEAAFELSLAVRGIDDEACVARPGDRCASRVEELLVPRLPAGRHAIVVSAAPGSTGPVALAVEAIDCIVGYVPFDEDTCVGFREVEQLPQARAGVVPVRLDDGRIMVAGGEDAVPELATLAIFDAVLESWSESRLNSEFDAGGAAPLGGASVAIFGTKEGELLVPIFTSRSGVPIEYANTTLLRDYPPNASRFVATAKGVVVLADGVQPILATFEARAPECDPESPVALCSEGAVCVAVQTLGTLQGGVCICAASGCQLDETVLMNGVIMATAPDAPVTDGFSALRYASSAVNERVFVHGFADGIASIYDVEADSWLRSGASLSPRSRVSLVELPGARMLIGGGLDDSGAPSAAVEIIDLNRDRVIGVDEAALAPGRSAHVQVPFGARTLVVGGRGAAGTLSDAFLLDVREDERIDRVDVGDLPGGRADMIVAVLDDARVLFAGGTDASGAPRRESWLFERVPRGFADPPGPPELFCGLPVPIVLDEDVAHVSGTTAAGFAELRAESCDTASSSAGPESTFSLHVDEPSSFTFEVTAVETGRRGGLALVWIVAQGCATDLVEVGCSTVADQSELAVSLPAGDYLVIVEAEAYRIENTDDRIPAAFELFVRRVGGAGACQRDEHDPDDDDPATAREPVRVAGTDAMEASGVLCAEDVDNLLIAHGGGLLGLSAGGIRLGDVTITPVDVDEAASIAAERIVYQPRVAETAPFVHYDDHPPGYYVVGIVPFESELEGAYAQAPWHMFYQPQCLLDDGDSLLAALDDERYAPVRRVLRHGEDVQLTFCNSDDVDVLVFDLAEGDVSLEVGGEIPLAFVELDEDGTILGELPAVIDVSPFSSSGRLAAADRPALFGAVIGPSTSDDDDSRVVAYVVGGPGDTCEEPRLLEGDAGELDLDTSSFFNDLDASEIGDCTGYRSPGADVVFSFALGTDESITVDAVGLASDASPDVALYILDSCPAVLDACVAGIDNFGTLAPETLTFTNPGAAQTFFLVVDSFYGDGFDVELSWVIDRL